MNAGHTDRWLDVLFGKGDDTYPFWLSIIRVNILLVLLCAAVVIAWNLTPSRLRRTRDARADIGIALGLTALAGLLRFLVARANVMDFGGIAYSRLLLGYKGYFATAQVYSPFYELTARDLEHAILFDRLAGTMTIPLVYVLCRRLRPNDDLLPVAAAFLFAVYPLHILFSASDALAIFSVFLAAGSYAMLAGAPGPEARPVVEWLCYLGGFAGLALLTQVRYENVLLLVPPAVVMFARRRSLRSSAVVVPLAISAALVAVYGYESIASGLLYQESIDQWLNLSLVGRHLALNPFMSIPVLFVGTAVVGAYEGWRRGALALLPWCGAFVMCILGSGDGHGAARIYANWLILILPCAGYGLALMLGGRPRFARTIAGVALLYFGIQPLVARPCLATQYVETAEHDRFKAMLTALPPAVTTLVVPDDELQWRASHSTLEIFHKYEAILAGVPEAAHRVQLVGLTRYLEAPRETPCAPGACVFFSGVPCIIPERYGSTRGQCEQVLRSHRTSLLEEATVVAAPFVDCAIYVGTLREQLCAPVMRPQRFALYRIEE